MVQIRDDPIIGALERSGYPPWFSQGGGADEEGGDGNGKL